MAELSMNRHGHAKQLVVFFGAATIGTGGPGAQARGAGQGRGRVVLVDEHRTSRVSSAVNGQQPCEEELDKLSATRPAGWKPPAGQVEPRLVRPAWSQERGQPVRGLMWCPVVAPRKPPQAPRSSQAATQPAASDPGTSTPPPAKRSKPAAEPTKGKGNAAKAKPAPQPGRWLDRDCNAALNMQRIGESRWRPLELCYWPDQGALPAKGKEYPGLGYKRLRDKPPSLVSKTSQGLDAEEPGSMQPYKGSARLVPLKASNDRRVGMAGPRAKRSARLAALAPAAPTGPPLPLDCEDPLMLRQLKDFCMFIANPNFKTCYNQLQRRLVRHRHPMLMPAFEDPSNKALLDKLQELCSMKLTERVVKLYAKAARAQLGWSGEEAQLFIKMACGYGINARSSKLKAATLDKGHVADLIEEANTHRRLLGMKKQGSLQDTLPLPCRMRHAVHVGIAEMREFVFDSDTQIGVGIDPGVTQAVSAASGVWDPATGQLMAEQLRRWKLTKGQVKHASGLDSARRDTERWLAPIKPHLQHLAAASSAGTSLEANLKHITVTLATWDAVWEVYLDPKWARQRLRLYGPQDRALEQFFNKLEEDMAEVSMKRHGHAKQLVVFFGAATIGTGGPGAQASGAGQGRGRVVLVDEHRTSRVSSAVNGQQPCEEELDKVSATRPAGWKPPAGQVEPRLVRPAWSQERGQPVRGLMWCPLVAPRKPPQAPRSSQAATQPAASEPGPSTPPPAKRSKPAAEPTKGKGKGKAAKAKPAPQPGRWLDRDCNAALNMQRIGESRWRPLELCYWPDQGALPAKGKEYPGLGYKRVRDQASQGPGAAAAAC
ncbi:hypothetical protein QJQ45_001763 [Haematococcus lacustris]|nr:hypothetical protein QJQ45_001763 [Haematococcus lacustris]